MKLFQNKSGQILVIVPFVVVFIVGALLLTINIGIMSREHIRMQTAADIAARDGALTQALALDTLTVMNDTLIGLYAVLADEIIDFLLCLPDPACWEALPELLEAIESTYKTMKNLQKAMDVIFKGTPAAVEAAVVAGATTNGASFASVKVSWSSWKGINLKLKWSFAVPGIAGKIIDWILKHLSDLKGILIRDGSEVTETVNVTAWKNGAPAYGTALLGKGLTFPKIWSHATAKPYWVGCPAHKRNPMDNRMAWWEQRLSMITPAFWWDAKMDRSK